MDTSLSETLPYEASTSDTPLTETTPSEGGVAEVGGESGTPVALTPNTNVTSDPGKGLWLTASGEALAVTGYAFPPEAADDTYMVDGWVLVLDRMIVTVGNVTLWNTPDVSADQSQHGSVAAHLNGPWAIDLHKGGPLTGQGGAPEQAQPFAAITQLDDGSDFDTSGDVKYGFGFSTLPATASALNVNLDEAGLVDYAEMIANGYSVLYVGHMTRPAVDNTTNEGSSTYDFTKLPTTLPFRLGFNTPTNYVNCQNGTEFASAPGDFTGEDYPRGILFKAGASEIAQVTVHADHPFWESFEENSPIHFDQVAAQYVGVTNPVATVEDMTGVDFTAFTDHAGIPLPLRSCVQSSLYTPPYPLGDQLNFDPLKVPLNLGGSDPTKGLRDYYDYIRYSQATQGHLNSQGLCNVQRQYPAPVGGSGG